MENYNLGTAMEKNGSITAALEDFPNSMKRTKPRKEPTPSSAQGITSGPACQRENGDQINVYLMCTLVSKSAKRIKTRAEKKGVFLPMALIVRQVLRAYRISAKDNHSPLALANPNIDELKDLNNQVFLALMKQWRQPSDDGRRQVAE
jgi:hypothetical protein